MIFRNLSRQPLKASLSVFGIALSVALLFVGFYFFDAVERIIEVQFYHATREDAEIAFIKPLAGNASYEISDLPSVRRVEIFRAVPARLRFGHRSRRVGLLGLESGGTLRRIDDKNFQTANLPPDVIVLTKYLADPLDKTIILGDNYRLDTRIVAWQSADVLRVNSSALFREGEKWKVFVNEGGAARLREVEIGHQTTSETEVLGGVNEGKSVILHPSNQIADGAKVEAN